MLDWLCDDLLLRLLRLNWKSYHTIATVCKKLHNLSRDDLNCMREIRMSNGRYFLRRSKNVTWNMGESVLVVEYGCAQLEPAQIRESFNQTGQTLSRQFISGPLNGMTIYGGPIPWRHDREIEYDEIRVEYVHPHPLKGTVASRPNGNGTDLSIKYGPTHLKSGEIHFHDGDQCLDHSIDGFVEIVQWALYDSTSTTFKFLEWYTPSRIMKSR